MAGKKQTAGAAPKKLTGQLRTSSFESPWWDGVATKLSLSHHGVVLSIEEITALVPSYPDGNRPRSRTVARRLRNLLQLVERGPNGSRGRGARYMIGHKAPPPSDTVEKIDVDEEWLLQSIRKMTK